MERKILNGPLCFSQWRCRVCLVLLLASLGLLLDLRDGFYGD